MCSRGSTLQSMLSVEGAPWRGFCGTWHGEDVLCSVGSACLIYESLWKEVICKGCLPTVFVYEAYVVLAQEGMQRSFGLNGKLSYVEEVLLTECK